MSTCTLLSRIHLAEPTKWKAHSAAALDRSGNAAGKSYPETFHPISLLWNFHSNIILQWWTDIVLGDSVSYFRKRASRFGKVLLEWLWKKEPASRNTDNFSWFLISTEMHYSTWPYRKYKLCLSLSGRGHQQFHTFNLLFENAGQICFLVLLLPARWVLVHSL